MPETLTLCYHALSDTWPAPLAVRPEAFEDQLELLLSRGYEPRTLSAAYGPDAPDRTLVVSFDDAFTSVLELAYPIMERLGVPGTLFVATAYPGSGRPMAWEGLDKWMGSPHAPELECMSWENLRRLDAAGWEIGSHTDSHPFLTVLGDSDLRSELADSRLVLERELGHACASLAYPYGNCDERVIRAAREAGYAHGAALDARLRADEALRRPRIGVYRQDDRFRFELKISRALRALRSTRLWDAVTATRRVRSARAVAAGADAELGMVLAGLV